MNYVAIPANRFVFNKAVSAPKSAAILLAALNKTRRKQVDQLRVL